MRELMSAHLLMSGDQWEDKMLAEAAIRSGKGLHANRVYRVCIAASHELEDRCTERILLLLREPRFWSGLPSFALTVAHRCLCFRLLSRMGCAVEELLRLPHSKMPFAVFRLLLTPDQDTAAELQATPSCLRDAFSDRFLKAYPDPLCSEALAILETVAVHLKVDIGQIECRHSSVRRILQTRQHTHTMSFDQLSGQFMSQQARTLQKRAERVLRRKRKLDEQAPSSKSKPGAKRKGLRKAKRGGGGGCRMYFSEQLKARGLSLRDPAVASTLHREYKALPLGRRKQYEEAGERAMKRWRDTRNPGLNSLGLWRRRRDAVAAADAKKRAMIHRQLADLTEEQMAERAVELALPRPGCGGDGGDYLATVSSARALARAGAAVRRMSQQEEEAALSEWRCSEGGEAARKLVVALGVPPAVAESVAGRMVLDPSEHTTVVRFLPDLCGVASSLTGELHSSQNYHRAREALHEDRCRSAEHMTMWMGGM